MRTEAIGAETVKLRRWVADEVPLAEQLVAALHVRHSRRCAQRFNGFSDGFRKGSAFLLFR